MEGASAEQKQVEVLLKTANVAVDSVAGSGKTFTALHIAKSNPARKHLLITYNAKLKLDTRKRVKSLNMTNLAVHTYHSYAFAKDDYELVDHIHKGIVFETKFDTVLVDEVQDMKPLFFQLLCFIVKTHTSPGVRLCLFGDRDQCIYKFMKADARYLTLAPQLWEKRLLTEWQRTTLSQSYRITQPMAHFVNKCMFGFDKMAAPKPSTVKPEYLKVNPWAERGQLYRRVRALLVEYKPEDVYILAYSLKNKMMQRLENNIKIDFPSVNTYAQLGDECALNESVLKNKLAFCTFHSSKGTERKVVVVLGFDHTYFEYYARDESQDACPNLLYVAATRATERLILVQGDRPLPFLKKEHIHATCDVYEEEALPPCEQCGGGHFNPCTAAPRLRAANGSTKSVTELLRHLDPDTLARCFDMLTLRVVKQGGEFNMMPPTMKHSAPPFENSTMEEVSDITGTAIPAFYEMKKSGACTLVDCMNGWFVRYPQVLVDMGKGRYRLPKTLTMNPVTAEDFLFWANCWLATDSGYVGRVTQLKNYDWFDDAAMEQCAERMDDTMLRINMAPDEYERKLDIDVQPETHGFKMTGRADMLDRNTLLEVKATSELKREHYLQVALYMFMMERTGIARPHNYLYNVLSDELVEVECVCLKDLVAELFRSKYAKKLEMGDDAFLASL